MKKLIGFIVLLLFAQNLFCQKISLERQRKIQYTRPAILDSLNISEPNFDSVFIEIRIFYSSPEIANQLNNKLTVLRRLNNHTWTGKSYSFYDYNDSNYDYANINKADVNFKDQWQADWDKIILKNYLNLPTEKDIEIKNCPDEIIIYTGGDDYVIQILTKKRKRIMAYSNPIKKYTDLKNCGINSEQYKDIVDFIDILNENFNIKLQDIRP